MSSEYHRLDSAFTLCETCCYSLVNVLFIEKILQEWTIDMTGQMSPDKRVHFWKSKRVFFVTPQVLEKDIQSGVSLKAAITYHFWD